MKQYKPDEIPQMVRLHYGQIAAKDTPTGSCAPSCCGPSGGVAQIAPQRLGYFSYDLATTPVPLLPCNPVKQYWIWAVALAATVFLPRRRLVHLVQLSGLI